MDQLEKGKYSPTLELLENVKYPKLGTVGKCQNLSKITKNSPTQDVLKIVKISPLWIFRTN